MNEMNDDNDPIYFKYSEATIERLISILHEKVKDYLSVNTVQSWNMDDDEGMVLQSHFACLC